MGSSGWTVPAKLDVYMWFGDKRGTNYLNDEALRGYDTAMPEIKNAARIPPTCLVYPGLLLTPIVAKVALGTFYHIC